MGYYFLIKAAALPRGMCNAFITGFFVSYFPRASRRAAQQHTHSNSKMQGFSRFNELVALFASA